MNKLVYAFDDPFELGDPVLSLGNKGAGLRTMTALGLPVPPGFTITTEASRIMMASGRWSDSFTEQIDQALEQLQSRTGTNFGNPNKPLIVSLRSGAARSMPGMLDSILNVGINTEIAESLCKTVDNKEFVWESYGRLIRMFSSLVMGVDARRFRHAEDDFRRANPGAPNARERCAHIFLDIVDADTGRPFPQNVRDQFTMGIDAVFRSWNNPRAVSFRARQNIDENDQTACTVQSMVFGNSDVRSGTGVAFSRDPSSGENRLYGEFLGCAQGEDVVGGRITPDPLSDWQNTAKKKTSLQESLPEVYAQLMQYCKQLEAHYRDVQDVEFTVDRGELYLLQTRSARRTPKASVTFAVDMVDEGLLKKHEALLGLDAASLETLYRSSLPDPEELKTKGIVALAQGLPASYGAAVGRIAFDAKQAEQWVAEGQRVILLRRDTSPEDVMAMRVVEAVVTSAGGMTSHAAVVARGLGNCCVVGCRDLHIDYGTQSVRVKTPSGVRTLRAGDTISVDGARGFVYEGELEMHAASTVDKFDTVLGWAREYARLQIRANADTPHTVRSALHYGAEGIGLCRIEHLFVTDERLLWMRAAIFCDDDDREPWLHRLGDALRKDFREIYEAMHEKPVTIRLLDWPLQAFLPTFDEDIEAIANALSQSKHRVTARASALREINPMLGHRGIRIGITHPDVYAMQARAIFQAALDANYEGVVEILLPFVSFPNEVRLVSDRIGTIADQIGAEHNTKIRFRLGAMLETPAACLNSASIAEYVAFLSIGTNDLTQMVFGISREDAHHILPAYIAEYGIVDRDPFVQLDTECIRPLLSKACADATARYPDLPISVCSVQAGDPESIEFFNAIGLHHISCPPKRLPVASIAAAQAAIRTSPTSGPVDKNSEK
ncbi:MAG: pyruvate, phosphate dikinase [Polyangiales bacterium]